MWMDHCLWSHYWWWRIDDGGSIVWIVVWPIVWIFLQGLVVVEWMMMMMVVVVACCKSWVLAYRAVPSFRVVASCLVGEPFQL